LIHTYDYLHALVTAYITLNLILHIIEYKKYEIDRKARHSSDKHSLTLIDDVIKIADNAANCSFRLKYSPVSLIIRSKRDRRSELFYLLENIKCIDFNRLGDQLVLDVYVKNWKNPLSPTN